MPPFRDEFPIFSTHPELVYLDSAATTQKPHCVIDAVTNFYTKHNASAHRGLYPLSVSATQQFEQARSTAAKFIGANTGEVVFTSGATDGLNLLAASLGKKFPAGSNIVLSLAEHHANFLPWQQLGLELRFANITATGEIDLTHLTQLIDQRTRVVSLTHCSNVLGRITPLPTIRKIIEQQGSPALLIADCSQTVPHIPLSVQNLGADFIVFSSHKLYGPSGVGVLWGKRELLESLPPYRTGGEMINSVTLNETTWNDIPWKFEAGTQNVEGVIGFAKALKWLMNIGMEQVQRHTSELSQYAQGKIVDTIIGQPDPQSGIISFTVAGIHPHDLAQLLGERGMCIRAGQHCAAPLHQSLDLIASCRISFGLYSTKEDVDLCLAAIQEIKCELENA